MKFSVPLALLATSLTCSAVSLVNPSFEDPDVPLSYTDLDATGWIVTESQASFQVSLYDGISHAGSQSLAFNASNTPAGGSVHQSFGTILGATYEVSFWTTANIPVNSSARAEVFSGSGMGGASLGAITSIPSPVAFSFAETSFSFVADSTTTTLAFIDNSSNTTGSDLFVDDVTVTLTVVPEPSMAMLSGLGVLALLARRRV